MFQILLGKAWFSMIGLFFERTLIASAMPSRYRPVDHFCSAFILNANESEKSFPLAQRRLQELMDAVIRRRNAIDVDGYSGATRGYRFAEGNSWIETQTHRGVPSGLVLFFSTREDFYNRQSPTAICLHHIASLVSSLTRCAPLLVVNDSSVEALIRNNPISRPSPPVPQAGTRAFRPVFV